jgi:hypothetical protein
MPARAPKEPKGALQLDLLLNANRITRLDSSSRSVVVKLLARLLLEAVQNEGAAENDEV